MNRRSQFDTQPSCYRILSSNLSKKFDSYSLHGRFLVFSISKSSSRPTLGSHCRQLTEYCGAGDFQLCFLETARARESSFKKCFRVESTFLTPILKKLPSNLKTSYRSSAMLKSTYKPKSQIQLAPLAEGWTEHQAPDGMLMPRIIFPRWFAKLI